MSTEYPFKINEWQDEEVEITTIDPVLNKKGEVVGLKQGTKKAVQRVRYSEMSKPRVMSCGDMEHDWHIPDKNVHTAHCRSCPKRKFIRAVFEQVKGGRIFDRDTQRAIA